MPRLYLVRHGRAAAGWEEDDPGLDDVGRAQADAVAERLAPLGPLAVVTSPLRRTHETAMPLAARWRTVARVDPAVRELPSPLGVATHARSEWLRSVMGGEWPALGPRYTHYRDAVVAFLRSLEGDTVVFSHFVAINAAIGSALGDDRMVILALDNGSITTIDADTEGLTFVEGGDQADTLIR
jgi:broad specificity phosphatase PhoE